MKNITPAVFAALVSAILFGASTPFAKQLLNGVSPQLLAGLLYLGSGAGLIFARIIRDRGWRHSSLLPHELPWLIGSIIFGGIIAPTLLMVGLVSTEASSASLLLNLETVFTAILAWLAFKENTNRRIVIGMLFIIAGGAVLSWPHGHKVQLEWLGPFAIAGACFCWAIDNNLTRRVSGSDALYIAGSKGLVAGIVNTSLAFALGATFPSWLMMNSAFVLGFFSYGISLVLFVLALRGLGTSRTSAYFSTAPFIGAFIAIMFFHEPAPGFFWISAVLMGIGVLLHLTEQHDHRHTHESLFHNHRHVHDDHHQHEHDFPWDGKEPHSHAHQHEEIIHSHPHYPDIHHRHKHGS